MRLSTSTNLLFYARENGRIVSVKECMRLCASAGYRVMDLNCCENADPGCPLAQDGWEKWVQDVKREADRLGLVFSQSHNPIYNMAEPGLVPDYAWHEELTRRSMIAAAALGVSWVVVHAGTAMPDGVYSRRETISRNADYFGRLALEAKKLGLKGIAIENMAYFGPYSASLPPQLCATAEGLLTLVNTIQSDLVQVCWDFGHANLSHEKQETSLRLIGGRLKATHVSDNMGQADDHTLPFLGTVLWERVLPVLNEIGYTGDLTYEIHKYLRHMPKELYRTMIHTTVETGRYLLDLAAGTGGGSDRP